jgi:hypothetical protein
LIVSAASTRYMNSVPSACRETHVVQLMLLDWQYAEMWDRDQAVPIEMVDGREDVINPGDVVIWENQKCHCCREAIRIERRLLN